MKAALDEACTDHHGGPRGIARLRRGGRLANSTRGREGSSSGAAAAAIPDGELVPADIREDLALTREQERQIAALEGEVKAKLGKILTAEQKKRIEVPRGRPEDEDHGRPVAQVAKELGVTPEQFREAFKKVRPAAPGEEPTHEQRQRNRKVLSEALGVSPERLDEVMDKYRPGGRGPTALVPDEQIVVNWREAASGTLSVHPLALESKPATEPDHAEPIPRDQPLY